MENKNMSKFYKIKVSLDDGAKDIYINKDKITRIYTYEDKKESKFKLVIYLDCNYDDESGEIVYSSRYDNETDFIKEINKLTLPSE